MTSKFIVKKKVRFAEPNQPTPMEVSGEEENNNVVKIPILRNAGGVKKRSKTLA